jgi:uncharacterized protein (DUF1697 family)
MSTRVAFLRAVNLGKRTVKMSRAVEVLARAGYGDMWTYINSGNVAFDAAGSRTDVERTIESALEAEFGFEITTFVRTAAELEHIVVAEPFAVAAGDTYFVTFLKTQPDAASVRALQSLSNEFDTLVVHGRDVHWRMHGKSTDSRLKKKDWEIVGKNNSTSRNINMLRKFAAKLAD